MSIRVIRGFFVLLALAAISGSLPGVTSAKEGGLTIVRIFTGWRDAASFKRISEYFDGRENTGGQTVLRTHPEERSGYYFLIRTANAGAATPVKINLELILPSNPKTQNYTFPTDLPNGGAVLNLGLTGEDWPNARSNPIAWKLAIVAADGRVLATEESYLWEKPAEK